MSFPDSVLRNSILTTKGVLKVLDLMETLEDDCFNLDVRPLIAVWRTLLAHDIEHVTWKLVYSNGRILIADIKVSPGMEVPIDVIEALGYSTLVKVLEMNAERLYHSKSIVQAIGGEVCFLHIAPQHGDYAEFSWVIQA